MLNTVSKGKLNSNSDSYGILSLIVRPIPSPYSTRVRTVRNYVHFLNIVIKDIS